MTHIIEYTKHSDNYLVYHFEFECNDDSAIGKYAGNCSLNKFMSLNDWHQILNALHEPVEYYIQNPLRKPTAIERQIDSTNFQLQITWTDMDVAFYSKLLHSIDFNSVFPFVIDVKVFQRSNVDKFKPAIVVTNINSPTAATNIASPKISAEINDNTNKTVVTPVRKKTLIESKKTPKENIDKSTEAITSAVTKVDFKNGIRLRDCCVRLPLLQFDENGEVIQKNMVQKKRKFSEIIEKTKIHSVENSPDKFSHQNNFMASSSSTPLVANLNKQLKRIASDVRGTFDKSRHKTVKRFTNNRLTTTPRVNGKSSGQFFPRLRLLKAPENLKRLDTSKRSTQKSMIKKTTKTKTDKVKRLKPKPPSITNESELFETVVEPKKKIKKPSENKKDKKNLTPISNGIDQIGKSDLKSISDSELFKSFDDHNKMISDLFHDYLKQTDAKVRQFGDYNHFDMISLFTTDQFSTMLDILFDKFVKIGEFGEICYDALFLELIVPEWALAIYMKRHALDRKTAIEQIYAYKSNENQNFDGYTSIVSIKLDDTMNTSTKQ
ncbi:uncharacterized protein LOC116345382 [Contarinia nasturtii]|uniref:uncharacterized protein LOC116345382 n=1 Tax=Contarinia nasturtii TaxID=265458 RepID=UPI0012D3ECFC|nr:uncharacterized protein LOC116345382 [Contarinia nasturtii]